MDDFGSGYSSLNTLKNYRFDEIKIDMAFLSQFTEKSQNIIKAIIRMAKEIGIHTLMEGWRPGSTRNLPGPSAANCSRDIIMEDPCLLEN